MRNGKNNVIFKGIKNGLIIYLNKDIDFMKLKNEFMEKIIQTGNFFKNAKVNIKFDGRSLSELEYSQLIDIIINETEIDISYIYCNTDNNIKFVDTISKNMDFVETIKGTVRSGQCIESEHSLIILGDVNPGAKIISKGNLIILGSLKGYVHAGYKNNDQAFIVASCMKPVQVRIGQKIGRCEDNQHCSTTTKESSPKIAYVNNESIYIEPIDNKSLRHIV